MAQNRRGYWNMDLKGKVMTSGAGGNRQLQNTLWILRGGKIEKLRIHELTNLQGINFKG